MRLITEGNGHKSCLSVCRSHGKADNETGIKGKAVLVIIMMITANLLALFILTPISPVSAQSIDQREEPALVLGSDVPDFYGMSVDDIWVYAYIGSSWEQIAVPGFTDGIIHTYLNNGYGAMIEFDGRLYVAVGL